MLTEKTGGYNETDRGRRLMGVPRGGARGKWSLVMCS